MIVGGFLFLLLLERGSTVPVEDCANFIYNDHYFISDHADPCGFYWCMGGRIRDFVRLPVSGSSNPPPYFFSCAPGSGTAYGDYGSHDLCSRLVPECGAAPDPDPPTTTTAAQTSPSTESPTTTTQAPDTTISSELLDHFEEFPRMNVGGGIQASSLRDRIQCLSTCQEDADCAGADFDIRDDTCWLHVNGSQCNPFREKDDCTHYRKYPCEEATTEAPVTPTTASPEPDLADGVLSMATGLHNPSVAIYAGGVDAEQCLALCHARPDCLGVDHYEEERACSLLEAGDYCGLLTSRPGVRHYIMAPCFNDPAQNLLHVKKGFHKHSGSALNASTLYECLMECLEAPECLAVDFNSKSAECFMHDASSACGVPYLKDECTHYSWTDCPLPASMDPAVPAPDDTPGDLPDDMA